MGTGHIQQFSDISCRGGVRSVMPEFFWFQIRVRNEVNLELSGTGASLVLPRRWHVTLCNNASSTRVWIFFTISEAFCLCRIYVCTRFFRIWRCLVARNPLNSVPCRVSDPISLTFQTREGGLSWISGMIQSYPGFLRVSHVLPQHTRGEFARFASVEGVIFN